MKRQLAIASLSVVMAGFALASATFAWFVSNTKVDATSSSISAQANGMVLQIVKEGDPIHDGGDHRTSATVAGHEISPSSTNDASGWYVPASWSGTDVNGYQKVQIKDPLEGNYSLKGGTDEFYAYTLASYTLYTITQTGEADVYLDGAEGESALVITPSKGASEDWFNKIKGSLRVGIMIDNDLKLVYAPIEPTGHGNDSNPTEGWSCVNPNDASLSQTMTPSYAYVSGSNYVDKSGKHWAATKSGETYVKPAENPAKLARVGYEGTNLKVVMWMEGTTQACQNMSGLDTGTDAPTFDVTLNLVGVVPDSK